jgi:hypothetical protein
MSIFKVVNIDFIRFPWWTGTLTDTPRYYHMQRYVWSISQYYLRCDSEIDPQGRGFRPKRRTKSPSAELEHRVGIEFDWQDVESRGIKSKLPTCRQVCPIFHNKAVEVLSEDARLLESPRFPRSYG